MNFTSLDTFTWKKFSLAGIHRNDNKTKGDLQKVRVKSRSPKK